MNAHAPVAPGPLPDLKTCPLHEIDAFHPELLQNPYPYFERLRAEAPVYRDTATGIVYVSTYDLIREVNGKPDIFSNDFAAQLRSGSTGQMDPDELAIMSQGLPPVNTLLTADPPVHTRYRKLTQKAFMPNRVEGMKAFIEQTVQRLLDKVAPQGRCEFKTEFADLLPMRVIAHALGVPEADMPTFKLWSDAFIVQLGGLTDKESRLDAARKIIEFQHYFVERIAEKRANPTEDVISDLVHADLAEEGDTRKMTDAELVNIFQQLLVAGNETTAHTLSAAAYYLTIHPEWQDRLRAEPAKAASFIEETLRHLTPVSNMWRLATQDAEVGGVAIKRGELLLVRYASANRDPSRFDEPDQFNPERSNSRAHLSFGAGIHTCLGAILARKEMVIALPMLVDRLRNIRVAEGDIRFTPNILLRGVLSLNLAYDAA